MADSLKKTLVEGTVYLSAGNTAVKFFSLVSYVIIVSRLDLHDYGLFALLTSLVGPASVFVFFGLSRIFVSAFAQARGAQDVARLKGLLREYYGLSIISLALFIIGSYFLKSVLVHYYDVYIVRYFWQVMVFIVAQLLLNMVMLFLEAHERFKYNAYVSSVEPIVRGVLVLLFMTVLSVQNVLVIYAVAKVAAFAVGLFYFFSLSFPLLRSSVQAEKKVLLTIFKAHGKWEIARNVLNQLSTPLKLWIIKLFVNVQGVAVYDFAQNVYGTVVSMFPVQTVIFPAISRVIHSRRLVSIIILKAKKYSFVFYTVVIGLAVLCLPPVLNVWFPQYSGQVLFILFLLLHLYTQVYRLGQTSLLYAYNQQKFLLQLYPISYTLDIILHVVLTYFFGIWGGVLSWHFNVIVVGFIVSVFLRKRYGIVADSWSAFAHFDNYDKMLLRSVMNRVKPFLFFFKKNSAP